MLNSGVIVHSYYLVCGNIVGWNGKVSLLLHHPWIPAICISHQLINSSSIGLLMSDLLQSSHLKSVHKENNVRNDVLLDPRDFELVGAKDCCFQGDLSVNDFDCPLGSRPNPENRDVLVRTCQWDWFASIRFGIVFGEIRTTFRRFSSLIQELIFWMDWVRRSQEPHPWMMRVHQTPQERVLIPQHRPNLKTEVVPLKGSSTSSGSSEDISIHLNLIFPVRVLHEWFFN